MTLVPLAATSTAGMIRRLGGRRWNLLHRLVYVTGVLAVVHYWWLVKSDISRPLAYGIVVALAAGIPDLLVLVAHETRAGAGSRDGVTLGVGVMARAPSSGGKTRLAPHLSESRLRALRRALLADTLHTASNLPPSLASSTGELPPSPFRATADRSAWP